MKAVKKAYVVLLGAAVAGIVLFAVFYTRPDYNPDGNLLASPPPVDTLHFTQPDTVGYIRRSDMPECSGLAASMLHPGLLFAHNDSGDSARLYLLDTLARVRAVFRLPGARNRDWEDIAQGPGPIPGKSYLYIGDIGNNFSARRDTVFVYRLAEPDSLPAAPADTLTLPAASVQRFGILLPGGGRDAEALFVDPKTGALHIITKREANVRLYSCQLPDAADSIPVTAHLVGTLPLYRVTAADCSPDGMSLIVKTYDNVYLWQRRPLETIGEMIRRKPQRLPYTREKQGEAIVWLHDKTNHLTGYMTLSESGGEEFGLDSIPLLRYRAKQK